MQVFCYGTRSRAEIPLFFTWARTSTNPGGDSGSSEGSRDVLGTLVPTRVSPACPLLARGGDRHQVGLSCCSPPGGPKLPVPGPLGHTRAPNRAVDPGGSSLGAPPWSLGAPSLIARPPPARGARAMRVQFGPVRSPLGQLPPPAAAPTAPAMPGDALCPPSNTRGCSVPPQQCPGCSVPPQ